MKKLVLIGRSEAGKTTLTQALRGEKIHYHKTQYVNNAIKIYCKSVFDALNENDSALIRFYGL